MDLHIRSLIIRARFLRETKPELKDFFANPDVKAGLKSMVHY